MYVDYMLRFANQAEATSVLFDGELPKYLAIDVIGIIYEPTGVTIQTAEGPVPEMAPLPGWHVNVRHTAEAPELDAFAVTPTPATPRRVWA